MFLPFFSSAWALARTSNADSVPIRDIFSTSCTGLAASAAHRSEELCVCLGLAHFFEKQFHGFHGRERIEHLSQNPDSGQLVLRNKQLFLTSCRPVDID